MKYVEAEGSARTATEPVSGAVAQTIADQEGVSPLDISLPLFDAVDPDALNRLYADGRTGVTVEFAFAGYRVTVGPHCLVELTPQP